MNGTDQRIVATRQYSITVPGSDSRGGFRACGQRHPNGDLYAGDYVEYNLYIGRPGGRIRGAVQKVNTDLTWADNGTPFGLDPCPGARGRRLGVDSASWAGKLKYYDSAKSAWVEKQHARPGRGPGAGRHRHPCRAPRATTPPVAPDRPVPGHAEDGSGTYGRGTEQYDQPQPGVLRGRPLHRRQGQRRRHKPESDGRGLYNELETDADYQDKANQTNRSDTPRDQGASIQGEFYAQAAPNLGSPSTAPTSPARAGATRRPFWARPVSPEPIPRATAWPAARR